MSRHTESASLDLVVYRAALEKMRTLVVNHITSGLVNGDDAEHERVRWLARRLDETGLNVDHLVDSLLEEVHGASSEWAWKSPSARKAEAEDIDVPF